MQATIGVALLASPFVAITIVGIRDIGWRDMAKCWGLTLLIAGVIVAGCYLIATSNI